MKTLIVEHLTVYLFSIVFSNHLNYYHQCDALRIKRYDCWGDGCDSIQSWNGNEWNGDGDSWDHDQFEERGHKEKSKGKGGKGKKGKKKGEGWGGCQPEIVAIKKTRIIPVAVPVRSNKRTFAIKIPPSVMDKSNNWEPQGLTVITEPEPEPEPEEEIIEEVIEEQPIAEDAWSSSAW